MIEAISNGETPQMDLPIELSSTIKHLIKSCWDEILSNRPSAGAIVCSLQPLAEKPTNVFIDDAYMIGSKPYWHGPAYENFYRGRLMPDGGGRVCHRLTIVLHTPLTVYSQRLVTICRDRFSASSHKMDARRLSLLMELSHPNLIPVYGISPHNGKSLSRHLPDLILGIGDNTSVVEYWHDEELLEDVVMKHKLRWASV